MTHLLNQDQVFRSSSLSNYLALVARWKSKRDLHLAFLCVTLMYPYGIQSQHEDTSTRWLVVVLAPLLYVTLDNVWKSKNRNGPKSIRFWKLKQK